MAASKGKPAYNKGKKLSLERKIENRIYRNVLNMAEQHNSRTIVDKIVYLTFPDFMVRDIIAASIRQYREELVKIAADSDTGDTLHIVL